MEKLKLDTEPDEPDEPEEHSTEEPVLNESNGTTPNLSPLSSLTGPINIYKTKIDKLCTYFQTNADTVNNEKIIKQIKESYKPLKNQIKYIIRKRSEPILDVRNILKDFKNGLTNKLNEIEKPKYNTSCNNKETKNILSGIISDIETQITNCNLLLYIVSIGEYNSSTGFNVSVYENLDDPSELSDTITTTANPVIETVNPKYKYFITVGTINSITEGAMAFGYNREVLIENALDIYEKPEQIKNKTILYIGKGHIKDMKFDPNYIDSGNSISVPLIPFNKLVNQKTTS